MIGFQVSKSVVDEIQTKHLNSEMAVDTIIKCFAMDCIMRTVLSMETGAVRDPNLATVQMGDNLFEMWRGMLADRMPWLCRLFKITLMNPKAISYFNTQSSFHP